jgi:hypothetical protein
MDRGISSQVFFFANSRLAKAGLSFIHYFGERYSDYFHEMWITKVTFTPTGVRATIQIVVWQFWGRAAEAS